MAAGKDQEWDVRSGLRGRRWKGDDGGRGGELEDREKLTGGRESSGTWLEHNAFFEGAGDADGSHARDKKKVLFRVRKKRG